MNQEIVNKVREYWMLDQGHPRRDGRPLDLPSDDILKELIRVVFYCGISKEEGRSLNVRIAFCDQSDVENEMGLLTFDEVLPFRVESLAKVASACDSEKGCILVKSDEDTNRIMIWGMLYTRYRLDRFLEVPVGTGERFAWVQHLLVVSTGRLGETLIGYGDYVVCRVYQGQVMLSHADPFGSTKFVEWILAQLSDIDLWKKYQVQYWLIYRDFIEKVIHEVSRSMSGGTVAIMDSDVNLSIPEVAFPTRYTGDLKVGKTIENILFRSSCRDVIGEMGYKRDLDEKINSYVAMASSDGALVLSKSLELIGHGAKIHSPQWNGRIIEGSHDAESESREFEVSYLGTRHRSAINLVGSSQCMMCFVVSEDGFIRGVYKPNEDVIVWPDFRVTMFMS